MRVEEIGVGRKFVVAGAIAAGAVVAAIALFPAGGNEPAASAGVEGEWRSRGYGWIWSISDGRITSYDHSASFCTRRRRNDVSRRVLGKIRPGPDGRSFTVALDDPTYSITFDRIDGLPDSCTDDPDTDEETIFRMVSEIFAEHYAFFEERNVDWRARVSEYDQKVDSDTDDEELFSFLTEMIAPIDDGHVGLDGKVDGDRRSFEPQAAARQTPSPALERAREIGYWTRGVGPGLVTGRLREAGGDDVRYGLIGEDIGYIQIRSIGGDLRDAAESGMDHARELFKDAKALIIDLTGNGGGYDLIARQFTSLLARERTVGYYKYPGDAADAAPQPIAIEPGEKLLFGGPVFVVTDRETISAAEILTMCLRALPNVTHIGEATRGSLSDILTKDLPNGWSLNLSNEVYLDAARKAWEGKGIRPHMDFMVHTEDTAPGDPEAAARAMIDHVLGEARKS
jgi:carboxyl-terminal processing protease